MNELKVCCIYHSVDLDGWMSAAIVKKAYSDALIDMIGYNYGNEVPDLIDYNFIILVDITLPPDIMIAFKDKIIWIDHHISAIYMSLKLGYDSIVGLRDTKVAACELAWEFFFPDTEIPKIVTLLGMYDSFRHKGTKDEIMVLEFQYAARAFWKSWHDCRGALENYDARTAALFRDMGIGIFKYLCTEAAQIYAGHYESVVDGYKAAVVNRERFNPINFGIDYHKHGYDVFICYHYAYGKFNYSIYNDNGEIDCSEIAKRRGGGGHKGAAGFRSDTRLF